MIPHLTVTKISVFTLQNLYLYCKKGLAFILDWSLFQYPVLTPNHIWQMFLTEVQNIPASHDSYVTIFLPLKTCNKRHKTQNNYWMYFSKNGCPTLILAFPHIHGIQCSFLHKMEAACPHKRQSHGVCCQLVPLCLITTVCMTSTTSRSCKHCALTAAQIPSHLLESTPVCVPLRRREVYGNVFAWVWGGVCASVGGWRRVDSKDVIICVYVSPVCVCTFQRVRWPRSAY